MKRTERLPLVLVMASTVMALSLMSISPLLSSGDLALAAEGCCMQRECPDDSCSWYVYPGNRESCKKLNDDRDGDDVESESGLIWWSQDC
jgi:hypothetical protein